jgi:hypothetical protein
MRKLLRTIKNFFYYGWTLRNSYDFDYSYCEEAFLLKLKRLQHEMNTCPYHMNLDNLYALKGTPDDQFPENTLECIKAYRALNLVIKLLERQQDSGFYGDFIGIYDFMQNYTHDERDMFNIAKKDAIVLPRAEYSKKLLTLHQQEARMSSRDRQWAFSLIAKYGNHWWV